MKELLLIFLAIILAVFGTIGFANGVYELAQIDEYETPTRVLDYNAVFDRVYLATGDIEQAKAAVAEAKKLKAIEEYKVNNIISSQKLIKLYGAIFLSIAAGFYTASGFTIKYILDQQKK
jgi:hypothetical protein